MKFIRFYLFQLATLGVLRRLPVFCLCLTQTYYLHNLSSISCGSLWEIVHWDGYKSDDLKKLLDYLLCVLFVLFCDSVINDITSVIILSVKSWKIKWTNHEVESFIVNRNVNELKVINYIAKNNVNYVVLSKHRDKSVVFVFF